MAKAFVFDIDDTIYDQQLAFKQAFNQQFHYLVKEVDTVSLYRLMREFGDETFSSGYGKQSLEKMQIQRIICALRHYQIEINDGQALRFQRDFEVFQEDIELFAEMPQIFDNLVAKGVPIGIITNGTSKRQSKKIEQLGLDNWILKERQLISENVGISKPSQQIFTMMASQLSLPPSEIIYIGDNYLNDIVGATSAGWQTIWTNYREFTMPAIGGTPNYIVRHPAELAALFNEIMSRADGV